MGKNRSYLSERRYQHNIDRKYDDKKLKYWEQVFGKETLSLLLKNNEKFRCYLNADEYDVKEEITEELPGFLRNEAAVKHDRLKWEESGTERALLFAEFYDRILEYGIHKLKGFLENKGIEGYCPTRYDSLEHDFSIHLAFQLQNICLRTLISEMHTYKQKGLLSGKDGKVQLFLRADRGECFIWRKCIYTVSGFRPLCGGEGWKPCLLLCGSAGTF